MGTGASRGKRAAPGRRDGFYRLNSVGQVEPVEGLVGIGEYEGCLLDGCRNEPVGVVVFGQPTDDQSSLKTAVGRFCPIHERDAFEISHTWDPEVYAFTVEGWEIEVRAGALPDINEGFVTRKLA